jgi:hypothetical protein
VRQPTRESAPTVLDRPRLCAATLASRRRCRLAAPGARSGGQVAVQHPAQQPNRPAPDAQIDVGVAKTDVTSLVESGQIVVGQARRATARSSYSSTV